MRQIRINTFETNSSSTHSMVIAMESDFNKWQNEESYADTWADVLITKDDLYKKYCDEVENTKEILFEDWINKQHRYKTYNEWYDYLEHDTQTFVTPSGEKIKIRCAFGYDG